MNREEKANIWGGLLGATFTLGLIIWKVKNPEKFSFWGWFFITLSMGWAAYKVGYYSAMALIKEEGKEDEENLGANSSSLGEPS